MLKTAIQEAQKRRKADAKQKYIALVVKGDDPDGILQAASEAGISAEQVERDADLIGKAAELAETAKALPGLLKRQAAASAKVSKAVTEYDRLIQPAQAAVDAAHQEEAEVAGLVAQSADAARELIGLHREHRELIPSLPAGAQILVDRDAKSAAREAGQRRLSLASATVARIRGRLQHAQAELKLATPGLNREVFTDVSDSLAMSIVKADIQNLETDLAAALGEQEAANAQLNKLEG